MRLSIAFVLSFALAFIGCAKPLSSENPLDIALEAMTSAAIFDLLEYGQKNEESLSLDTLEKRHHYNRLEQFGSWVYQDPVAACINTRDEVLLRSSTTPVSYSNPCRIAKGNWDDPYTGRDFKTSRSIQIDHVVPLKNAWLLGAHSWTQAQRCHFANFMDDGTHLLAVHSHENMSKSDKSPDRYLPPNEKYHCAYASIWLRIKAVWNLRLAGPELNKLNEILNDCAAGYRRLSTKALQKLRRAAKAPSEACLHPENQPQF